MFTTWDLGASLRGQHELRAPRKVPGEVRGSYTTCPKNIEAAAPQESPLSGDRVKKCP